MIKTNNKKKKDNEFVYRTNANGFGYWIMAGQLRILSPDIRAKSVFERKMK